MGVYRVGDLIADIVSEWLCLKGHFIIRGLKIGRNEIDILAIKPNNGRIAEAAHYEVSISTTPVGYLGEKSARGQTESEVRRSVARYVDKKYTRQKTVEVIERLVGKQYRRYFVTGHRKHEMETVALQEQGITIIPIMRVLTELRDLKQKKKARNGKPPEFLETTNGQRYYQLLEMARVGEIAYCTKIVTEKKTGT